MTVRSLFLSSIGLIACANALAIDEGFSEAYQYTEEQIAKQRGMISDALNMLRSYRDKHGVFLPAENINLSFDMGASEFIKNDVTLDSGTGSDVNKNTGDDRDGRLVLKFKSSEDGNNVNQFLSDKVIIFFPREDGRSSSGDAFYSYSAPMCVTDITYGGAYNAPDENEGHTSKVLENVTYFSDFKCKFSGNARSKSYEDLASSEFYDWTNPADDE